MTSPSDCKCTLSFELDMITIRNAPDSVREEMEIRQRINWCKSLLSLAKVRINEVPYIAEILYNEAFGFFECNLKEVTS